MEEFNFKDLVGKSILWKFPTIQLQQASGRQLPQLATVKNLSPTERYVLLEMPNNVQQWFEIDGVTILEVLE